jgi:NDP-sugar pyrophosphorylase family protein
LSLREIAEPDRFETVELEGSLVRAIRPRARGVASALINGGVYYFTRQAIEGSAAPSSLETDILPRLISRRVIFGVTVRRGPQRLALAVEVSRPGAAAFRGGC